MRARTPKRAEKPLGHSAKANGNAPALPLEPLLTLPECSRILRVDVHTVRRFVALRGLPSVRVGRQVRVDPVDLRRWIEARKW
jgi:excisionase family DNA binding protein